VEEFAQNISYGGEIFCIKTEIFRSRNFPP